MRVLVCGGRNYDDEDHVWNAMLGLEMVFDKRIETVIQGGANGADAGGKRWAKIHNRECLAFIPDWNKHGKPAGPIRNQEMLDVGRPDLVIAFPGGRGTRDMVSKAKAAGVFVIETGAVQMKGGV
jgi:hypothetical protein